MNMLRSMSVSELLQLEHSLPKGSREQLKVQEALKEKGHEYNSEHA